MSNYCCDCYPRPITTSSQPLTCNPYPLMLPSIISSFEAILSSPDNAQRAAAQQHLLTHSSSPLFMATLSSVIVTPTLSQPIKLLAAITLKRAVSNISTDSHSAMQILLQLMKYPLTLKIKATVGETVEVVIKDLDRDGIQRGNLNSLVGIELLSMLGKEINVGQLEWLLVMVKASIFVFDQVATLLLDATIDAILSLGLETIKNGIESQPALSPLKLITQILVDVFYTKEFLYYPLFQKILLNPKFQHLISETLSLFSTNKLLLINPSSEYSPFQDSLNSTKCNILSITALCSFLINRLNSENDTSVSQSPLIPKVVQYLEKSIHTIQTVLSSVNHWKQLNYDSVGRGLEEMIKYCIPFVENQQFYGFFSSISLNLVQNLAVILQLSEEERAAIDTSPEETVELIREAMEAGNSFHLRQFYQKDKQNKFSIRTIAGKFLTEVFSHVDGSLRQIIETCFGVICQAGVHDILSVQRSYLLFGVACNCISQRQDILECVEKFIENELDFIYHASQPTLDHKVYQCMRMVFLTLYHSMFFTPEPGNEGFSEELFKLVSVIFEGDFQMADENQSLVVCSYDLLTSLLRLDSSFVDEYTQKLLAYFLQQLTDTHPSPHLLNSLQELCHENKCLESLTKTLLECVVQLVRHIHLEMKTTVPNESSINDLLHVICNIAEVSPVQHQEEWKTYFGQNLLSLTEYFRSAVMIEERVVKTVVGLVRKYQSITEEQFKLVVQGVSFINTFHKMGPYYELLQLSLMYGEQYYRFPEVCNNAIHICTAILSKDNVLESELLKGLMILCCVCEVSRPKEGVSAVTLEMWQHIYSTLVTTSAKHSSVEMIKCNIIAALVILYSSGFSVEPQVLDEIITISQSFTHSVFASKVLTVELCNIIVTKQIRVPEFFRCALAQVVFICRREAKIFPQEEDDDEDYQMQKDLIGVSVYSKMDWLRVFNQTSLLLASNEAVSNAVLAGLGEVDKQVLKKISRLQNTLYGIREIRTLKRG